MVTTIARCGIRDVCTQKKLLVIDSLTLAKAVEVAQGEEAVDQNYATDVGRLPTTETTVGSTGHHVGTVANWDIAIAAVCRSKKKVETSQEVLTEYEVCRYEVGRFSKS